MVRRLTLVLFVLGFLTTVAPAGAQSISCLPDTHYLTQAEAQMQARAYAEALSSYTCALESDPVNEAAHVGRLEAAARAGDYLTAYGEAFLLGDGYPTALNSAIAAQSDILAAQPNDTQALQLRAVLNLFAGRADASLADSQAVLEREPDSALAQVIAAGAQGMLGDAEASARSFEAVTSLAPDDPQVYGLMAAAQFQAFDVEGMAANSARAIELGPDLAYAYRLHGISQLMMGNPVGALADASRAIELDPTYYAFYILRANASLASGDPASALADLSRAIELNPRTGIGHGQRAKVLLAQGDTLAAAADFNTAVHAWTTETVEDVESPPGVTIFVRMTAGRAFRLPFRAEAGELATLRAVSVPAGDVDPVLLVIGPDGTPLMFNDDVSDESLDAVLENYAIPTSGTYTLVVSHARGGSEGYLEISIDLD